MKAIQCKYSCTLCGINRQIVTVPARGPEDVASWLNGIATPRLVADHERRSPGCHPDTFSEVMIPIRDENKGTESEKIGAALK